LPQKLLVDGSRIIVNDFTGNKLVIFDPTQSTEELNFISIPSPVENSVTADFAIDGDKNIWYTNWIFRQDGVLIKFDHDSYSKTLATSSNNTLPINDYLKVVRLPDELNTPNGAVADAEGNIWLADTSASSVFEFDPDTEVFTNYMTSDPHPLSFGNASGVIKAPISRPYWIDITDDQKLVFNEQTANRIGVLDPERDALVEYMVPSMNPNWADCGDSEEDCGLAQVFDLAISGDKI
ncbi:MAG: lyase, partial [Aliifodinibius sp.]|nr:lyase [Fodinibius sp.]NIV16560.1 lyase [Fodinibius sp.]NIY30530.1 lyase [Fodinibius sp.]